MKITANGYYKADIVVKGVNIGMENFEEIDNNNFYEPTKLNIVGLIILCYFLLTKLVYSSEYSSLMGDYSGIYNSGVKAVTYDNFKIVKTEANKSGSPEDRSYSSGDWNGNGSGIIFSQSGLIATNYHVIEDASSIEVEFLYNGQVESFRAKVVRTDEVNDLLL